MNVNTDPDAYRLQKFMQLDGAILWTGGECPISDGGSYEVCVGGYGRLHMTPTMVLQPSTLNWTGRTISLGRHGSTQAPVLAYRLLPPPDALATNPAP